MAWMLLEVVWTVVEKTQGETKTKNKYTYFTAWEGLVIMLIDVKEGG